MPTTEPEKIEYRVRPVMRYQITRHHAMEGGQTGSTAQRGEYENADVAYEVAYALCRAEHEQRGWPPADERIVYPERVLRGAAIGVDRSGDPFALGALGART